MPIFTQTTPKYPDLGPPRHPVEEAERREEEYRKNGGPKPVIPKEFVYIQLHLGHSVEDIIAYLQENGVNQTDAFSNEERSRRIEKDIAGVYWLFLGSSENPGYVAAVIPANLIRPLKAKSQVDLVEGGRMYYSGIGP